MTAVDRALEHCLDGIANRLRSEHAYGALGVMAGMSESELRIMARLEGFPVDGLAVRMSAAWLIDVASAVCDGHPEAGAHGEADCPFIVDASAAIKAVANVIDAAADQFGDEMNPEVTAAYRDLAKNLRDGADVGL